MPQTPRYQSLKELRDQANQSSLIGREMQIRAFRGTLATPPQNRDVAIFNISGQGGIGKTTLLKQFRKIALEQRQAAAYVNEGSATNRIDNLPEALDRLVSDFETQGQKFEAFRERYRVYRQKKQELEADPEAPQGVAAGIGKFATKASLSSIKTIPGVGGAIDLIDIDVVSDKAGDWVSFAWSKFCNKDDVELVTQPDKVLTPLFLEALNVIARQQTVVLLLDTYEQTGAFFDDWLRAFLDDQYGSVSNCLVGIAGRDPLDPNRWTEWSALISRSELEPFSEAEAREYLALKGIVQEAVIQEIWRLSSHGLPLLIDMMAEVAPTSVDTVIDPCRKAVERFLTWETDDAKRQVAQNAALPRVLNLDLLTLLVGEADVNALFGWLKSRSFVVEHSEGWQYHSIVREQMLRYQRKVSLKSWKALHGKLATYYDEQREALNLAETEQRKDKIWQKYTLEWQYHSLYAAPKQNLSMALNGWLSALKASKVFAREWAETMAQVKEGKDCADVGCWGERLCDGLQAYEEKHYGAGIELFSALLKVPHIEAVWRSVALDWRGHIYFCADQYEFSLQDLTEAINLVPDDAEYWFDRGKTNHWMKQYDQALRDFDKAISIEPENSDIYGYKSQTYRLLENYEQAINDASRAIELDEKNSFAWVTHGEACRQMGNYDGAIFSFSRAVEIDEKYVWAISLRGDTHRLMENYGAALADLNRVIELDVTDSWKFVIRGQIHKALEDYEKAVLDFSCAIKLDENYAWAISRRGETYRLLRNYDSALSDFNCAIELNNADAWSLASRGQVYQAIEDYEKALLDFDRAIELDNTYPWAIASRGEVHHLLENHDAAMTDFNRAIELDSTDAWKLASRGEVYQEIEDYEKAILDFSHAIELNSTYSWAIANRGETYYKIRDYSKALKDFDEAIKIAPDYIWAISNRGEARLALGQYEQALSDFSRALELKKSNDGWYFYDRALAHLALNQPNHAQTDFDAAIQLAKTQYDQDETDWRNSFNLALYYLAAKQFDTAKMLYQSFLDAPAKCIREGIRDLQNLLCVFPNHEAAQQMLQLLESVVRR